MPSYDRYSHAVWEAGTLDIATREQARTVYHALRQQGRRGNADSEQEAPRSPHDCFPPRESTTCDAFIATLDARRIRLLSGGVYGPRGRGSRNEWSVQAQAVNESAAGRATAFGLRAQSTTFKARCHVNSPTRLRKGAVHAVVVLGLGMLGVLSSACDNSPDRVLLLNTATSFTPAGIFSPNPIRLAPLGGPQCPGGIAFGTSLQLIITAGVHNLTLDSVTLHMIDGTNLGGPSVTIPAPELATQFGSMFIHAGTTRAFALRPTFGCMANQPRSLRGNAFVFDDQGRRQTLSLEGSIQ